MSEPVRVTYENAADKLVESLPELNESYQAELKWWGTDRPGPHIIYGDILNPYIDRLLQAGEEAGLRRVFAFLEALSQNEDKRVQELVAVTVCEYLGNDPKKLQAARQFMGPATLKISEEVERFWGTRNA